MLSRTITGGIIIVLAIWFTVSVGFMDGLKTDYFAVFIGVLGIALGVFILFNKKEDEIEEIKK